MHEYDDSGFSVLTGAEADIVIRVATNGNDANDGLSKDTPKRTLAAAWALMIQGSGRQMLLRRGDTWTETPPWNNTSKSGRSLQERIVVGAYSPSNDDSEPRPIVRPPAGVHGFGAAGASRVYRYLAFQSIDFDSGNATFSATSNGVWLIHTTTSDILWEDCVFRRFSNGLVLQGNPVGPLPLNGLWFRRCQILDNANLSDGGRPSGVYSEWNNNCKFEECVFDGNGWNRAAGTGDTTRNHNAYFHKMCDGCEFIRCVSMRPSSHGIATGTRWRIEDNTFIDCPIGIQARPANTVVADNVVIGGRDISAAGGGGTRKWGALLLEQWGIDDGVARTPAGPLTFTRNLLLKVGATGDPTAGQAAVEVKADFNYATGEDTGAAPAVTITITDNVVYDRSVESFRFNMGTNVNRDSVLFTGNKCQEPTLLAQLINFTRATISAAKQIFNNNSYFSARTQSQWFITGSTNRTPASWSTFAGESIASIAAIAFPAATRTLDTYAVLIGLADKAELLTQIRANRKGAWEDGLTAHVINDYFRAGFGMIAGGPVNALPTAIWQGATAYTDTNRNGLESVTLDLTPSTDSDGTIEAYTFKEGTTTLASGASPTSAQNLILGTHIITGTVTDDDGGVSAPVTRTITVAANSPANPTTTANVGSITAAFDAYTNAGTYDYEYGPSNGVYTSGSQSISSPSLVIPGPPGTTIHWRGRVTRGGVPGAWTANQSGTPTAPPSNIVPVARWDATVKRTFLDNTRAGSVSKQVILDGSASFDPDGTIVAYNFSSDPEAPLGGPSPTLLVTPVTIGSHQYPLWVEDNTGAVSAIATMTITVVPHSPAGTVAVAGVNSATFSCAAYPNATGYRLKHRVESGTEQTIDSNGPSFPLSGLAGNRRVYGSIAVKAGSVVGAYGPEVFANPIAATNVRPFAVAGNDQTVTDTNNNGFESRTLNGSGSSDPDGTITTYTWNREGEVLSTAVSFTMQFPVGMHIINLTVEDNAGEISDPDQIVISVVPSQVVQLNVVAGSRLLIAAWRPSAGAAHYIVEASETSGGDPVVTETVTDPAAIIGPLDNETEYFVRVAPVKDSLQGAWSAVVSSTPTTSTPPAPQNNSFWQRVNRLIRTARGLRP